MRRLYVVVGLLGVMFGLVASEIKADDKLRRQATVALDKGVTFYHQKVAVRGGYV